LSDVPEVETRTMTFADARLAHGEERVAAMAHDT
jgi:hypothetical protein